MAAVAWRTRAFRELNTPLSRVLGPSTAKPFEALRVLTVGDLLRHLPRRYLQGTETSDLSALKDGEDVAILARIHKMELRGAEPRMRLEVVLTDGRGFITATFFGRGNYVKNWSKQLSKGTRGIFVGKVGSFNGNAQLAHPNFVMLSDDGEVITHGAKEKLASQSAMVSQVTRSGLIGLYPASAKLPTWTIADCAQLVLEGLEGVADPLPEWIREEAGVWEEFAAFRELHLPTSVEAASQAAERLVFDEAFATQLTMAYRRADAAHHLATPRPRRPGGLLDAFDARLTFKLTQGQAEVSEEVFKALAGERPMQRLLQGEVGSGKTIVAIRAMLAVVDAGGQAALMAPTEVLAAQHFRTITEMLGPLGAGRTLGAPEQATSVALLSGSLSAAAKKDALLRTASGEAGIVVGTHALLADRVQFADLGLVVVDEQHRFGVEQRAALLSKAATRPHVLVMTATPIPRSVAMTVFGDLELSTLREVPGGRSDVATVVVDLARQPAWLNRAWERVLEEVAQGRQAFVVCPRITATDASAESVGESEGAATVEETFEQLVAGPFAALRVERLHGQLPAEEKELVMRRFAAGEADVLVATTVIEVGVDVPNASMMVIWDADRFGISQLHQLRGRIGRGKHPGVCLLLTRAEPGSDARQRLEAVAATRDGFALAEVDLAQRREGDVMGAGQSGGSSLRLLRVLDHADVIAKARELAERAVAKDPARSDPGLADIVTQVEVLADADWLERN